MPSILNPIFNSTWEKTLTHINKNTPPVSIINTWWPPGHFIKSIAKRRVTFDGATINKPQAYWLANVFINSDERQSLGILRMLNTKANKAADYLVDSGYKLSDAVGILKGITPLTKKEAQTKLSKVMDSNQIDTLLNLTHKTPPPSYLLIYNELIEKNIGLSFVGNWNFKKMELLKSNPALRKQVPPSGSREYIQFLWDTVGGQPKYHNPFIAITQSKEFITFDHNIKIDRINLDCTINSETFGKGRPQSLFYLKDNRIIEKKLENASLPYSVILAKRDKKYTATLMDSSLARSLMMRLYFFEGKGLKYIRPFSKEKDLTGRTQIYVYKVDWEKFLN